VFADRGLDGAGELSDIVIEVVVGSRRWAIRGDVRFDIHLEIFLERRPVDRLEVSSRGSANFRQAEIDSGVDREVIAAWDAGFVSWETGDESGLDGCRAEYEIES